MGYVTNKDLLAALERLERKVDDQSTLIVEIYRWAAAFLKPAPRIIPTPKPLYPCQPTPPPNVDPPVTGVPGDWGMPFNVEFFAGQEVTLPIVAYEGMRYYHIRWSMRSQGDGSIDVKVLDPLGIQVGGGPGLGVIQGAVKVDNPRAGTHQFIFKANFTGKLLFQRDRG